MYYLLLLLFFHLLLSFLFMLLLFTALVVYNSPKMTNQISIFKLNHIVAYELLLFVYKLINILCYIVHNGLFAQYK